MLRPAVYPVELPGFVLPAAPVAVSKFCVSVFSESVDIASRPGEIARKSADLADAPTGVGKTSAHTDTYHGRFVKLVPDNLAALVEGSGDESTV
jgi:hypothetical protein